MLLLLSSCSPTPALNSQPFLGKDAQSPSLSPQEKDTAVFVYFWDVLAHHLEMLLQQAEHSAWGRPGFIPLLWQGEYKSLSLESAIIQLETI